MATVDQDGTHRERLVAALRPALADAPGGDPDDAGRLACLLVARERFESVVGAPPGGWLASLPPPFAGLELPDDARTALAAMRTEPGAVDPASLGDGYESALDATVRGERGQFFTPPPVAAALVRWALDGTDAGPPRVLDPAVGSGTFLLAAARRLGERAPTALSAERRSTLVGVDVDAVALQLAGLRLAADADEPAPEGPPLYHASFFDCEPAGASRDAGGTAPAAVDVVSSLSDDAVSSVPDDAVPLAPVDTVVGNPPYVRAEDLQPGADHYRRHLAAFGPEGETPLLDGDAALSRRSDAYVYFVTHATRFLRPGGRLALVLPTKWLMSAYGEDLRRFLRDRYRVHAVAGFDGRAFGDALVDTCLLLAQRDDGPGGPVRFVRLDAGTGPDRLFEAIARPAGVTDDPDPTPTTDDPHPTPATDATDQVVERPASDLTAPGSLARYLEAPAGLLELLDSPSFVRLDGLAEVSRGVMTGANQFFFVDTADVEQFGLAPRFRHPAVKSLRSVDRPAVGAADVERELVDVHGYVSSVRDAFGGAPAADLAPAVKASLAADGHDGVLAYVEHAEAAGWHAGRTCQSRPVWFDLGPLRPPAAFVPKLVRERVFAVRNDAGAVPSNAIDGVWPAEDVDAGALLAALNASVGAVAMEVTGRDEAGMLQLMTYETASLPTLDVRQLEPDDRRVLARAGRAHADDPGPATLADLDAAVDAAFDLPVSADELRDHARALRRRRVDGGEAAAVPGD